MGATSGITGALTATGASTTKDLIDAIDFYTSTLTISSAEIPASGFASSLVFSKYLQDLYDWSITSQGRFPKDAQASFRCNVTQNGTDLYLTNVYGFAVDLSIPVEKDTDFTATVANTWGYVGPIEGRFSINARINSANPVKLPTVDLGSPGHDLSFRIGIEDTNDDIISVDGTNGGARILSVTPVVALGAQNDVTIAGVFSGDVQIDGDNSIFAVSSPGTPENIALPTPTQIQLQAATGRTYTGQAFWSAFSVSSQPGSAINVSVTFQGTGELTIA